MMDDPSHLGLNYNRVDMEVRVKPFSNKQTVKMMILLRTRRSMNYCVD